MKKAILIDAAVKTHKGNVRGNNEDNFYFDGKYIKPEEAEGVSLSNKREDVSFLFGVCDGMGGENSGEKAAYMAANWLDNVRECIQNSDASLNDKAEQICESISRLNDQIYMKSKDTESFGMGTTLACVLIDSESLLALNLGDSRIYLARAGVLTQITNDHTEAQRLVRLGIIKKEQISSHKSKNKLSRYLGMSPEDGAVEPEVYESMELLAGDVILLCSDGLTDMLQDERIKEILFQGLNALETAELLIEEALAAGGIDNVTAMVVKVEKIE